jgi:hypothetical protein
LHGKIHVAGRYADSVSVSRQVLMTRYKNILPNVYSR